LFRRSTIESGGGGDGERRYRSDWQTENVQGVTTRLSDLERSRKRAGGGCCALSPEKITRRVLWRDTRRAQARPRDPSTKEWSGGDPE
jgi:hypothetical protein